MDFNGIDLKSAAWLRVYNRGSIIVTKRFSMAKRSLQGFAWPNELISIPDPTMSILLYSTQYIHTVYLIRIVTTFFSLSKRYTYSARNVRVILND